MHLVMLPPVVTDADRALVARQLGREPRTLRRVAVRCPFGAPAVTEQSPYGADGEPFPTTYYLTCRHLVAAISRVEAAGGVERWSKASEADSVLAASRKAADEEQRSSRRARGVVRQRARLARRQERLSARHQPNWSGLRVQGDHTPAASDLRLVTMGRISFRAEPRSNARAPWEPAA